MVDRENFFLSVIFRGCVLKLLGEGGCCGEGFVESVDLGFG